MMNSIRNSLLVLAALFIALITASAQNNVPLGVNYQCIIRDNGGKPIVNQNVVVNISIYSGTQADVLEWKEFHSVKTNNYGLVNLVIGEGNSTSQGRASIFANIPWNLGNLFVQVSVNFGQGEKDLGIVKLQSVPYSLIAQRALSIDYNNIDNKPQLNYLSSETDPVYLSSTASKIKASDTVRWSKPSSFTGDFNDLLNKPDLSRFIKTESDPVFKATVAANIKIADTTRWGKHFSGSYTDLKNKPIFATVATSGSYADLLNKPTFAAIATSGNYQDLINKPSLSNYITAETDPIYLSAVAAKIKASDTARWSAKSSFSGSYPDLRNKPVFATIATTGNYSDLTGKPSYAVVATSGNYQDLINKPILSGYITTESDPIYSSGVAAKIKASDTTRWSARSGFSGDYNDLINKPTGLSIGDMLYWNGTKWVVVPVGSNTQMLAISNGKPGWINPSTGGGTANIPQVVTGTLTLSISDNTLYAYFYNSIAISSSDITSKGICWGTSPNPTINNNKTIAGSGQGIFFPYFFGLQKDVTYYARAYAITNSETYYGNEVSFIADGKIQLSANYATAISSTKIKCAVNILNEGGYVTISRGFCWSTSTNPTISNYKNTEAEMITGLNPNTKYYIRAYATNSTGTYYSNEVAATTGPSVVLITTSEPSSFNSSSAIISGNISDDGGLPVTKRGICWGTSTNPVATGNYKENGTSSGSFEVYITGLIPNTKYYVRSYLINSNGIFYGNEVSFTTNPAVVTFEIPNVNSVNCSSAYTSSRITDDGTNIITAVGVCWSNTPQPITSSSSIYQSTVSSNFSNQIQSLTPNTTYYLRAFAVTPSKTFYSEEVTFKTSEASILVSTSAINNTNGTSANCYGSISADCSTYTESGICWATTRNPLITDKKVVSSSTGSNISAVITGLNFGTTYFVRAYVKNNTETIYGNEVYFTTGNGTITIETVDISNVTAISATAKGNITNLGGISLIKNGICWSTNTNPTLKTGTSQTSSGSGTGNYSANLNNLQPNKTYYVRAYAINARDTFYAVQKTFTTLNGAVNITTVAPTNVGSSVATSGGNITTTGGATLTDKGICWSTSPNPTVANSYLSSGANDQSFTSSITGLSYNTKYYIRAYAINAAGVWYGNELNFTTQYGKVFFSSAVSNIGNTVAQLWVKITDNGSVTITDKGICWSTSTNPTVANSKASFDAGTNAYYPKLTGLTGNTKYYARAYAVNSEGTWYSDLLTFTTSSTADLTDVDGNKYLTVTIGGQTWMAENLRTTHYQNGNLIPNIKTETDWLALSAGARCYYNNDSVTYAATGAFYNFYVVTDNRNICPAGWHVPSYNDWQTLTSLVTSPIDLVIGGSTGFNATLSGVRQSYGFSSFNNYSYFWASTIYNAGSAYYLELANYHLMLSNSNLKSGMSVRCIKD
jgi:uncharacterized protein (TIGR02145 family)